MAVRMFPYANAHAHIVSDDQIAIGRQGLISINVLASKVHVETTSAKTPHPFFRSPRPEVFGSGKESFSLVFSRLLATGALASYC